MIRPVERYFNIAGPCIPAEHYMLPALDRLPSIRRLIDRKQYFVIHAPRQTGKTTALNALVSEINGTGSRYALYCSLETLQVAKDPVRASQAVAELLLFNAHRTLPSIFRNPEESEFGFAREPDSIYESGSLAIRKTLSDLAASAGKPFVVFFDEADCLAGDVLLSFLRQLRDGCVNRERIPFPASIALVGMLDVRDYKAQIRPDGESLGQISPFNIISKDLTLRNFTEREIADLYAQHTAATGQVFEPGALAKVWKFTYGQPWLVNALAREYIEEIHDFDYAVPIAAEDVVAAKETIIRRRDTHVDSTNWRHKDPCTLGLSEGWMAVFDTDPAKPWEEKLYTRTAAFGGKTIHVIGL